MIDDAGELERLVQRFQDCTLPKSEWTHQAHLTVGTWHVRRYGPDVALERMRAGIRQLNDAHGTPNSDTEGYHETITRAYIVLIAAFCADQGPNVAVADCARALQAGPLADRNALRRYWTPELLMSVRARRGWVDPDLRALNDT